MVRKKAAKVESNELSSFNIPVINEYDVRDTNLEFGVFFDALFECDDKNVEVAADFGGE